MIRPSTIVGLAILILPRTGQWKGKVQRSIFGKAVAYTFPSQKKMQTSEGKIRGALSWWFPEIGVPPKSSIFMGFFIPNQPFSDTPIEGNLHLVLRSAAFYPIVGHFRSSCEKEGREIPGRGWNFPRAWRPVHSAPGFSPSMMKAGVTAAQASTSLESVFSWLGRNYIQQKRESQSTAKLSLQVLDPWIGNLRCWSCSCMSTPCSSLAKTSAVRLLGSLKGRFHSLRPAFQLQLDGRMFHQFNWKENMQKPLKTKGFPSLSHHPQLQKSPASPFKRLHGVAAQQGHLRGRSEAIPNLGLEADTKHLQNGHGDMEPVGFWWVSMVFLGEVKGSSCNFQVSSRRFVQTLKGSAGCFLSWRSRLCGTEIQRKIRGPRCSSASLQLWGGPQRTVQEEFWAQGAYHEISQGLVNVLIEHHPTIPDIISNKYLKVMFKITEKGHLPTPVSSQGNENSDPSPKYIKVGTPGHFHTGSPYSGFGGLRCSETAVAAWSSQKLSAVLVESTGTLEFQEFLFTWAVWAVW